MAGVDGGWGGGTQCTMAGYKTVEVKRLDVLRQQTAGRCC